MTVKTASPTVDREWLVDMFLARLAVYQMKADKHMFESEMGYTRGEIANQHRGAIEWLAGEIGIFADLEAAGYEPLS